MHIINDNRKAFSFMQLVLAIAILGISLSPILMVNLQSNRKLVENRLYTEALGVLTQLLDYFQVPQNSKDLRDKDLTVDQTNFQKFALSAQLFEEHDCEIKIDFKMNGNTILLINYYMTFTNENGGQTEINRHRSVYFDEYAE